MRIRNITTSVTDGDKGDITVSAGATVWNIDADAVGDAELRNSAATSVIGRSAGSVGDPADIAASADGQVLRRAAGALGFGADVPQASVTGLVAALAAKVESTRLINTTAPLTGGGDLSADRTLAISDFTAVTKGAVPNPGGSTSRFLRDDATWVAIASLTDGDKGDITVSGGGATWTIDADVVSDTKLRNSAATSVIGRSAGSAGDPADIASSSDGELLRRAGGVLGFGADLPQASVSGLSATLSSLQTQIDALKIPVGGLYFSTNSTNPATSLGYGTWSAFGAGRVPVGLDAGDTDWDTDEETGGAKTVASAGTNANESAHTHSVTSNVTIGNESAHTHSVTSNVTIANESAHTHTYTEVVNHTHGFTDLRGATAGASTTNFGGINAGLDATSETTTVLTANPGGGVASGTTAAGSAHTHTPTNNAVTSGAGSSHTHTPTNNAVTSAAGSAHTHTFTGSATSVVQPYITVRMWKRTA